MKCVSLVIPVMAASLFSAPVPSHAASTAFDGGWSVTLDVPEYKDPTGVVARAYTFEFPASVGGGVLHGEHGTKGMPSWLALDGAIQANGSALLHAHGITGRSEYNLGHAKLGKPYEYDVKARFQGNGGTGQRVGGRIGNFHFVKR